MSATSSPGLASIIVPCWNQLEFTRHCIAALVRFTRAPWELVVINNGSTDGTRDYLAVVRDAAPIPVTVVANATNIGFPAASNQGMKCARGECLVLLNNDAVVTEGWLEQLVALTAARTGGENALAGSGTSSAETIAPEHHSARNSGASGSAGASPPGVPFVRALEASSGAGTTPPDHPLARGGEWPARLVARDIGLVGPMSNYASPPQLVEGVAYRDLNEMHVFARRWREERRGQWFTVPKLSGFCLLMKREVYDANGGLDEQFGLALFDDDDLAIRAGQAGFELAVAHDLFIHHFGGRTFAGNGVDTVKLLGENEQRFAAKWGPIAPGGERVLSRHWGAPKQKLPGPPPLRAAHHPAARPRLRVAWEGDFEGVHSGLLPGGRGPARAGSHYSAGCRSGPVPAGAGALDTSTRARDSLPLHRRDDLYEKGFDLLLTAFGRAFRASDPVGLVIKEMGSKSFYRGQTAENEVRELRDRGYRVEYIDQELSDAGLYTACDCFVHPFRGEGFGLPIVEAMACGLPVIVTGAGPALDYANEETAYLIPAERGRFAECRVGEIETIGRPWLFEPDVDLLVELLKRLAGDRAEARAKGMAASAHIREHSTWDHTAADAEQRLLALAEKTDRPSTGDRVALGGCVPVQSVQGEGKEISRKAAKNAPDNRTACHVGAEFAFDQAAISSKDTPCSFPADSSSWRSPVASLRLCVSRPKVSLTMIVRDEQENLPRCLGSVAGLFDEIVVVDTGSKDRTREIAGEFGARVFDFVWVDCHRAAHGLHRSGAARQETRSRRQDPTARAGRAPG